MILLKAPLGEACSVGVLFCFACIGVFLCGYVMYLCVIFSWARLFVPERNIKLRKRERVQRCKQPTVHRVRHTDSHCNTIKTEANVTFTFPLQCAKAKNCNCYVLYKKWHCNVLFLLKSNFNFLQLRNITDYIYPHVTR